MATGADFDDEDAETGLPTDGSGSTRFADDLRDCTIAFSSRCAVSRWNPEKMLAVGRAMRSLIFTVVVLLGGCTVSTRGVPNGGSTTSPIAPMSAGACPVTTPPPIAVMPPPPTGTGPNPSLTFRASSGTFLYGNDTLIVILPNDGTIRASDPARGLSGGVKFPWWRIAPGDLVIETRRLDAITVAQAADVPTGYGDTGFQVSGLNFAAMGCWQVSGTVGGKTLTFVVNVDAR